LYRKVGNKGEEAATSVRMAVLQRDLGQLAEARDTLVAALPALQASGDRRTETLARCELGETLRRLGEGVAARELLESALATLDGRNVPIVLCLEQALARVARDAGDSREALTRASAAVRAVERLRSSAVSPRWRASALAANQEPYDLLVEIHMREHERDANAGHAEAAFAAAERGRARGLLDLLSEGDVDVREGVPPELRTEERSLRQRLNVQAAALDEALAQGRSGRAELIWREVDEVTLRLAEVEAAIRRTSPRYAALTQPEPVTFGALKNVLDGDTQLVLYALGGKASYAWVASPSGLEAFRLAPRARIDAAARRLRDTLTAGPSSGARADLEAAKTVLSDLVLAPLARSLAGRRLLVVAPGALQYVPFAVLSLPTGEDLFAQFEVVSAPSASVVATLRAETPIPARKATVAVFADPVFERSDPRLSGRVEAAATRVAARGKETGQPVERALAGLRGRGAGGGLGRLPFSSREANVIASLTSEAATWKAAGFDANREAATSTRLADFRIVHFATHGVLNTRRPELSGVVLSLYDERGRKQDGFLRLHDVYNLHLDADLVVLSGCQTALGKDLRGEGLVGLTRGFLYAGARAVVASLWQVDDESTAELMARFYRGMLKEGRRPADALRVAQLEMSESRRWSAPFHWAGFVLQGDWR
jgi:CHAT domain-containing protein